MGAKRCKPQKKGGTTRSAVIPGVELGVELHLGVDNVCGLLLVLGQGAASLLHNLLGLLPGLGVGIR